jgi:hypothetical protein
VVKVHRGEGLASCTSPEPCMAFREGRDEASVGKTRKPAIVPRKSDSFRDADDEGKSEGNTSSCGIASAEMVPRGLRTWRAWKSSAREPGEITAGQRCWPASGRRTRRSR